MMKNSKMPPVEQIDFSITSSGRTSFRRLIRQRAFITGLLFIIPLVLMAIFAESLAPFDPAEILIGSEEITGRTPPCIHVLGCPESRPQHILGTDRYARDFFSRIIYGARVSLLMGIGTVGSAMLIGTFLGASAGYSGGWWDSAIMRVMDVLLAFPVLLLALALIAVEGPGLQNMALAITIGQTPIYARLSRASVISLKETAFVEASRALGGSRFHIISRRILPNTLTPLIVQGTLGIASAILDTAALSFLGFGSGSLSPNWGAMIGSEFNQIFTAPYLLIFPGLAITITVLAFNLMGDGFRDAFDPRWAQPACA